MARLITLAKGTLAFLIVAVGGSIIIGTLMGGGFSKGYDEMRGVNTDPRSVLVQAVFVEADRAAGSAADHPELPAPGQSLDQAAFAALLAGAERLRAADAARVRTPAMLVQHRESGTVSVKLGNQTFDAAISPSVIDTKHGPVLRVALRLQRADTGSAQAARHLTFETAYTAAPGAAMVLDLADLGAPGTRAILALRTTLIDPTPAAN
jgi:hypothetical protein